MGQAQDGVRVAKEMTTTVTKTSSTTRTLPGARSVKRKKQRSSPLTWSSRRMPRAKQAAKESRVPSDSRTHKILQRRSPLRQASRRKNNLKFRIRSSETTKRFNSTNPPKLHYPSEFDGCRSGCTKHACDPDTERKSYAFAPEYWQNPVLSGDALRMRFKLNLTTLVISPTVPERPSV
ncbi:hypothetical protein PC118_g20759 [Phytophthora cactorum]|uniref:Uncharacterized protein n=1 Tax=Phytophthora cactorum TaxID=29920 RepID=A0A8T1F235_9STRA|nr:hypothetical protein PC118_g20759 [Phytophthora cactorum]